MPRTLAVASRLTYRTVIHTVRDHPKHKAVAGKVSDAELTAIAGHIRELAGGSAAPK